ncbi:MAG: AmmeMemoRadiSam system protein B [Methanocorpusculum sp.]|uniref:AmmeMemoRadiSam system protein B n=1 Tax=Methanocorpusculum sp. TaxID=2058474 RepID=UPI002723E512|nr:AmmeMemoRadiSam system protein B [Methanocorpusculum sp.]MDO9523581.1 AmmeMemoRadiSam system protein B [Methanocorpusculum sp.]
MISKIPAEPKATEKSVRLSTLSGIFYPKNEPELKELLSALFASTVTSVSDPYGILVPHAGYIYSGQTAACGYAKISPAFAGTFVLIGPSHTGVDTSTSDMIWETPIGNVLPDLDFIEALSSSVPVDNDLISIKENSLEVQIPFIRYRFPKAKIVPILMGDQSPRGAERVAQAVLSAAKTTGIRPIIIASGDGSHYVQAKIAEQNDLTVLAAIRNLDTSAFYDALSRLRPSMCGFGCIAAMAEICASFGAKEARVILYQTSGDVTGDLTEVVGYAAMEVV